MVPFLAAFALGFAAPGVPLAGSSVRAPLAGLSGPLEASSRQEGGGRIEEDGVERPPIAKGSPTRPHDVWAFRSVLDGHPRMLTIALHDDLWVAYDATTSSLYQAWAGGVKFDGAVYTTAHGPQPTSQGVPYARWDPGPSSWSLGHPGRARPVVPRFRGYRFEHGRITILFDIELGRGRRARIAESPEYKPGPGGRVGLERRFRVEGLGSGRSLTLLVPRGTSLACQVRRGERVEGGNFTMTMTGDGETVLTTEFAPGERPPSARSLTVPAFRNREGAWGDFPPLRRRTADDEASPPCPEPDPEREPGRPSRRLLDGALLRRPSGAVLRGGQRLHERARVREVRVPVAQRRRVGPHRQLEEGRRQRRAARDASRRGRGRAPGRGEPVPRPPLREFGR